MSKIIACDFDGTLCVDEFPGIGPPREEVIDYVKLRKEIGDTIILWSCRVGERLQEAINWCTNQGLIFDYVNENAPEIIEQFGSDSRKIKADEYIDDKSLDPELIKMTKLFGIPIGGFIYGADMAREND